LENFYLSTLARKLTTGRFDVRGFNYSWAISARECVRNVNAIEIVLDAPVFALELKFFSSGRA
jgi:hypothetical protein